MASSLGASSSLSLNADDDIGKDFGSSWKANDDAMDFGFDTASSGKKNKFNFDNLDMDFNLDGDFGKLSSFNVDMGDLDFASPAKISVKPKERSETKSSEEISRAKKDHFSFSFDFNELDSFNIDSSPLKERSLKNLDKRGSASDIGDGQGSKSQQVEDADMVKVNAPAELRSSENSGGSGAYSPVTDTCLDISTISGNLTVPNRSKTSEDEKVANIEEETDQQQPLPEHEISTGLSKQTNVLQNIRVQSVANEYTEDTDSNTQTDVCPLNQDLKSTSDKEESKDVMVLGPISDLEDSERKDSSSLCVAKAESNNCEGKLLDTKAPLKNVDETEPSKTDVEVPPTSRLLKNTLNNTISNKDVLSSTRKLMFPSVREPLADKLTLMKEKEDDGIHSDIFQQTEETGCELSQPSSAGPDDSPYEKKSLVRLSSFPAKEERNKLIASIPRQTTKTESVLRGNEDKVKVLHNIGENFNSDDGQRGRNLATGSRYEGEAIKQDPVTIGTEKSTKLHVNLPGLTGMTSRSSAHKVVNPRPSMSSMVSTLNSKVVSAEGLKPGKGLPESSLRNSRVVKANTDQLYSTLQKGSLKILDQKMENPEQKISRIAHPVGNSRKNTLAMPSLKRKISEELKADLEPSKALKSLSESPKESRNFKETSPKIVEEQVPVRNHESKSATKSVQYEHQISKLPVSREVDMAQVRNHEAKSHTKSVQYELQSSKLHITRGVDMARVENTYKENNGSVERAEAYTKELEDICNMLKKKHEEAKEIMVRAVVNNNKLLMLNHPIYDEKIRMVQHFAARLTSKELAA